MFRAVQAFAAVELHRNNSFKHMSELAMCVVAWSSLIRGYSREGWSATRTTTLLFLLTFSVDEQHIVSWLNG